jgi:predicted TIM-barrel fold metal-dependent hydrolase
MIIDIHAHICDLRTPDTMDRMPLSVDTELRRLDEDGIDMAIVLPWPICPEAVTIPGLFAEHPDVVSQVRAAAAHPDRLIPFGNLDPRWAGNSPDADFGPLLRRFREMGCLGIGELGGNLHFDDPRVVNVFRQCGEAGFPVVIESCGPGTGQYGLIDEAGSPRLESLLKLAPSTTVVGHGPGFWAEIGAGLTDSAKSGYPRGPLGGEGSLWRLMREYANLRLDLSAGSGYNAITRDPDAGLRFLREFSDRAHFGTDTCFADDAGRMPHLGHLRRLRDDGSITETEFRAIAGGNTARLLGVAGPGYR